MIALGPLPWDVLTDPSDPDHGVNSQAPRGAQFLGPMLLPYQTGPLAPATPSNAPPFDAECWSPILDVPVLCEPYWQVLAWMLDVSISFTIQGVGAFSGGGSVQLLPTSFLSVSSGLNPPPFYASAPIPITFTNHLPQGCGVVTPSDSAVSWSVPSGFTPGPQGIIAAYLQSILMTPGNMQQCQVCPVVEIGTPYSTGPLGAVGVSTGPSSGVVLPVLQLQVDASSRWPSHKYRVPLSFSDPNGLLLPSQITGGGSVMLTPSTYWNYSKQ